MIPKSSNLEFQGKGISSCHWTRGCRGGWCVSEFELEAWHPLPSQPASLSQLLEVSKEESSQPPGTSSDPANYAFFIPVACPGLHPPHGSAQSQPEPECLYFSPEAFSLAWRHRQQGSLHDPIDLYRLLLAAVPCWLHFKARVAKLLQVSEAAGMLAKGFWQEGC